MDMHVALLCNTAWLDEELTMFRYMVVGLIDENVRVVQVVPDRVTPEEFSAFGARLTWKDSTWDFLRTFRLGRLRDDLEEEEVDIIHAVDGRLWPAAIKLATTLKCPAILTANSHLDVPLAQKLLRRHPDARLVVVASTQPLADGLSPYVQGQHQLRVIRPGVHVVSNAPVPSPASGTLCAVISGATDVDGEYEALLLGLVPVVADYPQAQFFLDGQGQGREQHLIWQVAQKLGLLSNISLVPRKLGHRELLLGADVLIHPQPMGKCRGLTLQAMARGIPIIAHQDAWLDYFVQDKTAWVIDRPHPELWTQAISRLIHEPQLGQALGQSARKWVGEHHIAADHVRQTLALYQETLGESYKFPTQAGSTSA